MVPVGDAWRIASVWLNIPVERVWHIANPWPTPPNQPSDRGAHLPGNTLAPGVFLRNVGMATNVSLN